MYRKIVVDKLLNADHLWTIYCDSTGYPYMVDDDIVVLYDYTNHARVEEQLGNMDMTFHMVLRIRIQCSMR